MTHVNMSSGSVNFFMVLGRPLKVITYAFYDRNRNRRIFVGLSKVCLFLVFFIYLNYRFNMPVFHVYKNQNITAPCVLPKFDFYDTSIQQFFWKHDPLPCENWLDLFFVDNFGFITMNISAMQLSGYQNLKCRYKYINRISETKMTFSSSILYSQPTYMNGDFIHMECFDNNEKRVYNNLHINIDAKNVQKSRHLVNESESRLSVYIVGIDSLSRLIAERKLKKTMNYLKTNLSAYVLKGYTRIADSSYPNLVPIFTGFEAGVEDTVGVNNLPYIFKNFSRLGAVDFWAEDWHEVASFKGFKEQPTRHYIQPLMQAMDKVRPSYLAVDMALKFLQNHKVPLSKVSALCFGNKYRFKMLLLYYQRFIEAYSNIRKFGYSWTNEIAHDLFNLVDLADDDYFEFFKWMKETNRLQNAVLIFMADHGPRYSEIGNTDIGRISNRLPLMSIVLPDHIKSKYSHIHKNLQINTERLTTAFDVFEMLKDVLNENFEQKDEVIKQPFPRGISLFREIPNSRSCRDASISEHYCPCYSSKRISTSDMRVVASVDFVVSKINNILNSDQDKCAKLTMSSIESASLVRADLQRDVKSERSVSLRTFLWNIKERTRFLLQFKTNPGGALFEATVQYTNENSVQILGDVNRINRYGNQSSCINDTIPALKRLKRLYCYCI